jgi:hypothetical protein
MGTMPFILAVGVMLIGPHLAAASPSVIFGQEPDVIGIVDCAAQAGAELNLTINANVDADVEPFSLRLVMYSQDNSACLSNLNDCDLGAQVIVDDEGACGCIQTTGGSPDTLNWTGQLTSLDNALITLLCEASTVINFRGDLIYETDLDDEVSEVVTLTSDLDPPAPLASKPVVRAAENALIVTLDTTDRSVGDVTAHDICVRRLSGTPIDQTENGEVDYADLDGLRAGFTADSCKRTERLKSDEYRYDDLENDVQYAIVVATYDAAGNRSVNSELVTATPASLLDFAELYSERLGGAEGETGGCSAANAQGSPLLVILMIIGLIGLRKERK